MSLLSKKFFDLLPSSVEFSEEIKDYITGLIDDLDSNNNNETDLREVTEQFLVDAGIPKNDIEKLYIDLAANNIVKNSDNDKELEKLSNKILNKINQISNKETKTNTNNINSNVDKKSKKQLINTASTNDDSKKTAVEEVDLKDVNVIVGDKELLVDAHVKFKTGVHYGLIGRNGVGKSTFLKSIGYNKLVGFPKNIRVLYIEQLESVEEKTTVLETVVKADKERTRLLHEKQILQNAIESNEIKKIDNEKGDNGEIELKPYQLFQLAQEEVTATTSKTNGGGGGGDNGEYNEIAKKLFEMALEGFDKLLLESKLQEKKKNDGEIQKGVDMLKELVEGKEGERNEDEKNSEFFESWLALGKGQIYLSKLQSSKFDDDNEQENYTISESELNLYSQGIKAFDHLFEKDDSSQEIWGSCLYNLVKLKKNSDDSDIIESSNDDNNCYYLEQLDKAIKKLSSSKVPYVEMLGQAYLLKSTLEHDDIECNHAFEKGIEYLFEAYELDPGNENLKEQLMALEEAIEQAKIVLEENSKFWIKRKKNCMAKRLILLLTEYQVFVFLDCENGHNEIIFHVHPDKPCPYVCSNLGQCINWKINYEEYIISYPPILIFELTQRDGNSYHPSNQLDFPLHLYCKSGEKTLEYTLIACAFSTLPACAFSTLPGGHYFYCKVIQSFNDQMAVYRYNDLEDGGM
ncbi:17477_t:CDS:10, partial [Entrophospora sp. SA101]